MNAKGNGFGAGKGNPQGIRQGRRPRVAPVASAVRTALAFSALALATAGPAWACDILAPSPGDTVTCDNANYPDTIDYGVDDLTVVVGDGVNLTTVTPAAGDDGVYLYGGGAQVVDVSAYAYVSVSDAVGVHVESGGSADIGNAGSIYAYNGSGIIADAVDDVTVTNTGIVYAYGNGFVSGIEATSDYGTAAVTNNGAVYTYSTGSFAGGIYANGQYGASVANTGLVDAEAYGSAIGMAVVASDGLAQVDNRGGVYATSRYYGNAYAIAAYGQEVEVGNSGGVRAIAFYGNAVGIGAYGYLGVSVTNDGSVYAGAYYAATGIRAFGYGDVVVENNGYAGAYSYYGGDAIAIEGRSVNGSVTIINTGAAIAEANGSYGNGIGLYGYSIYGDVAITNTGAAVGSANGSYGVGDGIFASGVNVSVDNQGAAIGEGGYWGAGIEVQGGNSVYVSNSGYAYGGGSYYGFGIYAIGGAGGATVVNSGVAVGQSYGFAHGIYAESGGDTTVTNAYGGLVVGGDATGSFTGTGIHAMSYGIDATVSVDNAGQVIGQGYYGGTGIEALALNEGSTASVSNSGFVYAQQYSKYGYGANGIVAVGDAGASIDNQYGGVVVAVSGGLAYGALALSQSGDATVVNAGDIVAVSTDASKYYGAYGVVAASGYGSATADNSGFVGAYSVGYYRATGITASGPAGATVINSGEVNTYGKYSIGIQANAGDGIAQVDNTGLVVAEGKYSYGAIAISSLGDAIVGNDGTVIADGYALGAGLLALSTDGDANVTNGAYGSVYAYGDSAAFGVYARSTYGNASVSNDGGTIGAQSYGGNALGIAAGGYTANVDNSGLVQAVGYYGATGVAVQAQSSAVVDNAGSIYAVAYNGDATGVQAIAYGSVSVHNSGIIGAGSLAYDAIGILGYTAYGDVSVSNEGGVLAVSKYGLADGVFAYGQNVVVANDGYIGAYGATWAAGIEAQALDSVAVTVGADGTIFAYSGQYAMGIYASGGAGGALVENAGSIEAQGYVAMGIYADAGGDVTIGNSGDIVAGEITYYGGYLYGSALGTGIHASSYGVDAAVVVNNSGSVSAAGYFGGTAIEAIALNPGGTASVTNSGTVQAYQYAKYGYGTGGIVAAGDAGAGIDNSGLVDVFSGGTAYGLLALSPSGNASVVNSGDVYVESTAFKYYGAYGILASSQGGTATIDNSGLVDVSGKYAYGVLASAYTDAVVTNAAGGAINAYSGFNAAFGALALSATGNVSITNAGSIYTNGSGTSVGAFGISSAGDTLVVNSGDISAYSYAGMAVGALSRALYGQATADNSGDVYAFSRYGSASGLIAQGDAAIATNSGTISAEGYYGGIGISAYGVSSAAIDNAGDVGAYAYDGAAVGLYGYSPGGTVVVGNSGNVLASSVLGLSIAARAQSAYGSALVDNGGSLVANGVNGAGVGAAAISGAGDAGVVNSGSIHATSLYADAYGAFAVGVSAAITNSGDITAVSDNTAFAVYAAGYYLASVSNAAGGIVSAISDYGQAVGLVAVSQFGDAILDNAGEILAETIGGSAIAAYVAGYGSAQVSNSGTIHASAGDPSGSAVGLVAISDGDVTVTNSGTISADHDTVAVAVSMVSDTGVARLYNSGTIETGAPAGGSIAVLGGDQVDEVHNTGEINGAIITGAGDDLINNAAGGSWYLVGPGSDLGDGADNIDNAGTLTIVSGVLEAGAGDDSLYNAGLLVLAYSGIDLGDADSGNVFVNSGTIQVIGDSYIDLGTAGGGMAIVSGESISTPLALGPTSGALANDGVISFVDGATDDVLTVYGNFGGDGAIHVDVDLAAETSDMLYVEGDIVGSDPQTINVSITEMPADLDIGPITVVVASGDADPNAFVAGSLTGFESELLAFGLTVDHSVAGTDNLFSLAIVADGLSDGGVLAATVAPGVHSLIGTSVGTLRQRVGILPTLDGMNGLGPWVRWFDSDGDVRPTGSGFAAGENLGFSQQSDGIEIGMNFTVGHGFHYGVLLGKADGRRGLAGGSGSDQTDLDSAGLYATWLRGDFYFDASWRWMDFESRLRTATASYQTSGNARAFNLEAGYTGWKVGAMTLVPQIQYTRTRIDNMDPVAGTLTEARLDGGDSERLRVGLGLEHSFLTGNGIRLTPYGSLSAIHESDGRSSFIVNGDPTLAGSVEADGTTGQLELGIGVQKGGWSLTGGVNWNDGGAVDSTFGGQLVVRWTW